ncbi:hypothetical protein [Tritonibacter mobilis]|uniref:hypothetical protein n=2 Tax=Tritonibacter mobilis TaxID=379347 RepID=UPI0024BBE1FE|nr:hypothetical protein [Tritonibacter mobilis]WHQ84322.1 hypothetical protein OMR53_19395 [Tritonibacter mobilis]
MMPELKLGAEQKAEFSLLYDDSTGSIHKGPPEVHYSELAGAFRELMPGDFWGRFTNGQGKSVFFHADQMYEDDPDRFLIFVDVLGPTQARLHFVLDGAIVEQVVYKRMQGVGLNPYDAFESDLDMFMFFSEKHAERRDKWPSLF